MISNTQYTVSFVLFVILFTNNKDPFRDPFLLPMAASAGVIVVPLILELAVDVLPD